MTTIKKSTADVGVIPFGQELLVDAWSKFKEIWQKLVWAGVIIPLFPAAVLVVLVSLFIVSSWISPEMVVIKTIFQAGLSLLIAADVLALIYCAVSGLYAQIFLIKESNLSVREAFDKSRKYFWRYIWLTIISAIVIMVGFILVVIPGIVFSIWFSFAFYVLVFEGVGGIAALKRSRNLVRGFWWTVLARLIVISLLGAIASALFNLIMQPGIVILNGITGGVISLGLPWLGLLVIYLLLAWAISVVVNYIITVVSLFYNSMIYKKLVAVKAKDTSAREDMPFIKKIGWILLAIIVFPLLMGLAGAGQKLNDDNFKNYQRQQNYNINISTIR